MDTQNGDDLGQVLDYGDLNMGMAVCPSEQVSEKEQRVECIHLGSREAFLPK